MKKKEIRVLLFIFFVCNTNLLFAKNNYYNTNEVSIKNFLNNKNDQNTKSYWRNNGSPGNDLPYSSYSRQVVSALKSQFEYAKKYKFRICFFALAGSYLGALYTLNKGKNYLQNNDLWSNWPCDRPFELLLQTPQKNLAKELLHEIQYRFQSKENVVSGLIQFMDTIETERKQIIFYKKLYTTLKKLRILTLFPLRIDCFEQIKEKLERLVYLKNVLLSWTESFTASKTQSASTSPHFCILDNTVTKKESTTPKESLDSQDGQTKDKLSVQIHNYFTPNTLNYLSNSNVQNAILKGVHSLQDLPEQCAEFARYYAKKTKKYFEKTKKYIIPAAMGACYVYVVIELQRGNTYLAQEDLWCNWKDHKKLACCTSPDDDSKNTQTPNETMPAKEILTQKLLEAIQIKHVNPQAPLDFISPFALFMQTIETERKNLLHYQKLYNILEKSRLLYLFVQNTQQFLQIPTKLRTLLLVRDLFVTWAAHYKVTLSQYKKI